jgi:predicted amidophosphoribosyltransferase
MNICPQCETIFSSDVEYCSKCGFKEQPLVKYLDSLENTVKNLKEISYHLKDKYEIQTLESITLDLELFINERRNTFKQIEILGTDLK